MSIWHPIAELRRFQNLTLKIKGQGHGWGHSLKSQCGYNILSTHIPFVPCQSALLFLRYSIFKIWPWKSRVKVMGEVQGWGQVKYLYLVFDGKSPVLGTYLYLTLWNSKVLGTYLYLKAKYLILVQVLSSTIVKLTYIFRLKFGICFVNKSPLNTIMINYWNGSYCVLTAWGLQTSRLDCLPWSAGQKYLKSLHMGDGVIILDYWFLNSYQG